MVMVSLAQPDEYVDSLGDLLDECAPSASRERCAAATLLGVMSAYVLPVMLTLTLVSNCLVVYVFARRMRLSTRFAVYLCGFCAWDSAHAVFWGLGWFFLAKGLPYASGGTVGFLVLNAGEAACRLTRFAQSFFSGSAIIVLLVGAVDRCLSVMAPLRMRRAGRGRAVLAVLASTGASLALSLCGLAMVSQVPVNYWSAGGVNRSRLLCGVLHPHGWTLSYYVSVLFRLLIVGDASLLFASMTLVVNVVMSVKVVSILRRRRRSLCPAYSGWQQQQQQQGRRSSQKPPESRDDLGATMSVILMSAIYLVVTVPKVIGFRGIYGAIENRDQEIHVRFLLNIADIGELLMQWTGTLNVFIVYRYVKVFREHIQAMLLPRTSVAAAPAAAGALASNPASCLPHRRQHGQGA